jgi:hypothetical protein
VIFPGVPIVFCGIDRTELGARLLPPEVRGVLVKREFAPTLDIALSLHPGTDRVVVVTGTSEFDTRLLGQAKQEFRPYEDHMAFTYLNGLPLEKILTQVSKLPPRAIVLYTTVFKTLPVSLLSHTTLWNVFQHYPVRPRMAFWINTSVMAS